MESYTRRTFLGAAAAAALAGAAPAGKNGCTLSIGTYSLQGLALEDAIPLVHGIGYDGIELAVLPGLDGAPATMPPDRRVEMRQRFNEARLRLTALMEQITPSADDRQHRADVDRLGRVADLARDLATGSPPLIQTVLGDGTWEAKKDLFRDRLGDWSAETGRRGIVLAIKPHRGGALSRPEEAVWLIRQLKATPWLRMVYDYSHYAYRDMTLADTVKTALPITAHVAVKDAIREGDRVTFDLPGAAGTVDYVALLRLLFEGGYRGDVCCEVSRVVWSRPGYEPLTAARTCYGHMARAFKQAGVPRG
jgi:inosose dehydratase